MADIFISYASPDRERARLLAEELEQQAWSVWWDREIQPGRVFDDAIEEALNAARCVIVLWSNESVHSDWVKAEATEAAEKRILVPALIDKVKIPLQFRRFQAADLTAWTGGEHDAEFRKLAASIARLIGGSSIIARPLRMPPANGKRRTLDPRWLVAAGVIAVLVAVAAILLWTQGAKVKVPSVVGQNLNQAIGSIAAADLTTGNVTQEPSQTSALGTVLQQQPLPGATATKGTAVALVVAAAPDRPPSRVAATENTADTAIPGLPDIGSLLGGGLTAAAFEIKEIGLHITFVDQNSPLAAMTGARGPGALVFRLDPGTAQKAGLHVRDVITRVGATAIVTEDDLRAAFRKLGPGKTRFTVKRGGEELTLDVECPGCVAG